MYFNFVSWHGFYILWHIVSTQKSPTLKHVSSHLDEQSSESWFEVTFTAAEQENFIYDA